MSIKRQFDHEIVENLSPKNCYLLTGSYMLYISTSYKRAFLSMFKLWHFYFVHINAGAHFEESTRRFSAVVASPLLSSKIRKDVQFEYQQGKALIIQFQLLYIIALSNVIQAYDQYDFWLQSRLTGSSLVGSSKYRLKEES